MTCWLVGIAPSIPGAPALTPVGKRSSAADRLRIILHMSVEEFLNAFPNRTNVLNRGRGAQLQPQLTGSVFVFGTDAWRCLHLPDKKLWEVYVTPYARFHLLPHPSGRNRVYNSTEARARLRRLLCRQPNMSSLISTTPSLTQRGETLC